MSAAGVHKASDDVIRQLNELFGSVLNLDIIKSVAESCQFDIMECSNKLLEICHITERKNGDDTSSSDDRYSWKSVDNEKSSSHIKSAASYNSVLSPKKSKKRLEFETAVGQINKGYKVLVLMRGLPGSGKTSLAMKILEHTIGLDANYHLHILSTDDYFCQNAQKRYQYDVTKLEEAHNWNQNRSFRSMSRGFSPIIIDNTNTQMWEMKTYATMAIDYGYLLYIIEPDTHWCYNVEELAKRNVHGVPKQKIRDVMVRYEKGITPQKLLCAYNLVYKFQKPPQLRLYPPVHIKKESNIVITESGSFVKSNSISGLMHKTDNVKQAETINLMEFDDDDSLYIKKSIPGPVDKNQNSTTQNLVDNLLTFNHNNESKNILKPTVNTEGDIFEISSDDENEPERQPQPDFYSGYKDWGVQESALRSWDIVTPINDSNDPNKNATERSNIFKETKMETTESSCSTEDEYFRLLKNDQLSPGYYGGLVVVETVNRDINYGAPIREPVVPLKLKLDKSCITDDVYDDYDNHISELENLFPSVPKTHLSYWYNKCKGDLEWTIEFLLEAKDEVVSLIVPDDSENDEPQMNRMRKGKTRDELIENNNPALCNDSDSKTINNAKKKHKKTENPSSPDEKDEIKKLLERKIKIGGEHYSKELLRVKNYRLKKNSKLDSNGMNINEPSTSKSSQFTTKKIDEIVVVDSDLEFDEPEVEDPSKGPEETVELNLGDFFVSQLEHKFADPNIRYPKGFQPVVQMPVTLAKQLYSFYVESIYQQMENQDQLMENLVKEDEEFARRLQAKEMEEIKETKPESFKEIQEGQLAAKRAHENEVDKWKNLDPDTMALTLTKQKLFSLFRSIPQDTLVEVLHAHENKYTDTIETLLASTQPDNIPDSIEKMKHPPIEEDVLQEMKEAQKNSSCAESEEQMTATHYREEATSYLTKRKDLYQKAQRYHQRGMTEVAQFYSGLASLQTIYYDRANNMAATAFLDEHSKRLEDFNTLDLHFLYVKEAIPALDVFLDRNIQLLRHSITKQCEYLQIITGRGNRSNQGISKLKPAVTDHLNKRKVKFVFLNPGLLKVKIYKHSSVTSELSP